MISNVILIGPAKAGKTTVGKLLAAALDLPLRVLAETNERYAVEHGFDPAHARTLWETQGFESWYRYSKPFDAHALERALSDDPAGVVEVSAFQSVYEDDALFAGVAASLRPFRNIVLLRPSPDVDESIRVLEERDMVMFEGMEINEHFVRHHSNHDLAKQVVYTAGRTPEESRDEILDRVDATHLPIILIGPIGAGKSTLGRLLAERLGVPQVAIDTLRWGYYEEIGWSKATQDEIAAAEGFAGVYRYWKPFEEHAVKRALAEHQECVMDFGAGHSVYEDAAAFARMEALLKPYPNVALILPSGNLDESVAILRDRQRSKLDGVDITRHVLTHRSNRDLATLVIYTGGKTPAQTCDEILARLDQSEA